MEGPGEDEENEFHRYIFDFFPKVSSGLDHYACVAYAKKKPTLYCWGGNSSNQLGVGINIRHCNRPTVVNFFENFIVCGVACTNYTTSVLVKNNVTDNGCFVYTFGKGNNGLLGYRKERKFKKDVSTTPKENRKKKLLSKINNDVNKTLLNAFGVTNKERDNTHGGSNDSILSFEADKISSEEDKSELRSNWSNEQGSDRKSNNQRDYIKGETHWGKETQSSDTDFRHVDEEVHRQEEKQDWFTPFPMKVKFPELTKVKYISCGDMHTLAISTGGILYGWGVNTFGCVGNGRNEHVYEPTRIFLRGDGQSGTSQGNFGLHEQVYHHNRVGHREEVYHHDVVVHCSAGGRHSLACLLSGDMYSWGYGANGRLGLGDIRNYNAPQLVKRLQNRKRVVYVCSGKSHSSCVDADYNVYTWGCGKFYKLGHGDDTDRLYPQKVEFFNRSKKIFMTNLGCFNSIALNISGDVFMWGTFDITAKDTQYYTCKIPKQVNTNYKCISVHASTYAPFAVSLVGDLLLLGKASSGISNIDASLQRKGESSGSEENLADYLVNSQWDIRQPYGDFIHRTCITKSNGIGAKQDRFPVTYVKELRGKVYIKDIVRKFYKLDRISYCHYKAGNNIGRDLFSISQKEEEYSVEMYNRCTFFEGNELVLNTKVRMVDGSDNFSIFLVENGKVYVSGINKEGELGNGKFNLKKKYTIPTCLDICVNKIVKIACGHNYVLALNDSGIVYGWGKNDKSQLGIGIIKDCYEPVHVKSLTNVINVYAGYDHSACIISNTFFGNDKVEITHGELYVWGNAESGKLGLGHDYTQGYILLPRKISLTNKVYKCALGTSHSLFLTDSNDVYVCGNANNGRLGLGEEIKYMLSYPKKVILNENVYIKDIVAGATFSIALSMDGFIYIWGEFVKNKMVYDTPTLYTHISNVKMITGKYHHIFFLTYDNKLFGIGDNSSFQIVYDTKKSTYIDKPKIISHFFKGNIENVFSFRNATFVQMGNGDLFAWGYAQNGHLGLGLTQITYIKFPQKIVKTWLTYEENEKEDLLYDRDSNTMQDEDDNKNAHMYGNYVHYMNEINMLKSKISKRRDIFLSNSLYAPYYVEEIEKIIYELQIEPNEINWEFIQMLLKREEYNNSIDYIKSYEDDLVYVYTNHMQFLLNLNVYEQKYNYLYLSLENFILSNIANMKEALPTIMHSKSTHLFDNNREKLQRLVYILQQQPIYLIILCLLHNHKNVKNIKRIAYARIINNGKSRQQIVKKNSVNYLFAKSNMMQLAYDYDTQDVKGRRRRRRYYRSDELKMKHTFYHNSTLVICSFIFDLYADLKNTRVKNIFTMFLIKIGIEEMKLCLHIDSLYKIETSIFFLLMKMLFMKNDFLVNFSHYIANMRNGNSFVRFLDGLSRKVPSSDQWVEGVSAFNPEGKKLQPSDEDKTTTPILYNPEGKKLQPSDEDKTTTPILYNPEGKKLQPSDEDKTTTPILYNLEKKQRQPRASQKVAAFLNSPEEEKDKEFSQFVKGKTSEQKVLMSGIMCAHPDSIASFQRYDHMQKEKEEERKVPLRVDNLGGKEGQGSSSPDDTLVEVDFVHVFKELCKLITSIKFPNMVKVIMKYLFKHFTIYERNISRDDNKKHKIYLLSDESLLYLPFFNLLLMAFVNPLLKNVEKLVDRFYFPPVPVHVIQICNRLCDFIEVLYLNRYDSLSAFHLQKNFISLKFIYEHTFNSFVGIINRLCQTEEDIYVNMYIDLFHYHLDSKPHYVQLKLFQVCHMLNLIFRFQNYLQLSFNDPVVELANFFYDCKRKSEKTEKEPLQGSKAGKEPLQGNKAGKEPLQGSKAGKEPLQGSKAGKEPLQGNKAGKEPLGRTEKGVVEHESEQTKKGRKSFLLKLIKSKNIFKKEVEYKRDDLITGREKNEENVPCEEKIYTSECKDYVITPDVYHNNRIQCKKKKKKSKIIFDEEEISHFVKCKLVYNIKLDVRFLLNEKNMNVCEFTKIPMPQYMIYKKKTILKNNDYLFSFIGQYRYEKDNMYILAECLKNCPSFEQCRNTNSLIVKLKSLETYYASLQHQKEVNIVHIIRKTIDILLSNDMIYVNICNEFPPNLYLNKFKNSNDKTNTIYKNTYTNLIVNTYDKSSFFNTKWRNIALQLCLNILQKKNHMNYLRRLYNEQDRIEEMILSYKQKMKTNMETLKGAIIFVSKILIEKPILIHASYFGKNLHFLKLKMEKNFRRGNSRNGIQRLCNTSTVHVYSLNILLRKGIFKNIHRILTGVVDNLTIEIFFDLNNIFKFNLVFNKGTNKNVINTHTFSSTDVYSMYNGSPFLLHPLFPHNGVHLLSASSFTLVHLLRDLLVDLY
ncbi:guanidine nucleotide exchange factor, putative [Plasmodium ovale curtisi]|uniref:Guanidine nucleotide exchange factor, putative n=1 Tax=Plasmodium ovale curtisi TaxID=864141 RepID=A0A1A8WJG6_PLAOA|nr:guanidine nucleotide exchange factor, putative [Plasmodium ovale curtisi]